VLGISTLLEKIGVKNKNEEVEYIQQPLTPPKFMYRPETFDAYISQEQAKDKAKLTIELINKGFPRHFLLMGNAGHGKTTLAGIIAKELGFNFNVYVGSNFDIATMNDFLMKNQESTTPNVLMIDEIGELDKKTLTYLLPLIEDFKLGNLNLRKFILVGATTDTYVLSKRCQPFLDRIHAKIYLTDYSSDDIIKLLIQYNSQIHKANITSEVYEIISNNCRYTPRLAISLFDYVVSSGDVSKVLNMNRIIKDGLDDIDIKILDLLANAEGKTVGEEAISIIANMTRAEYKQLREPYLMRQGLILRTTRGRTITNLGLQFLQGIK
jgi:Holliday junction DNA helicase RuvB